MKKHWSLLIKFGVPIVIVGAGVAFFAKLNLDAKNSWRAANSKAIDLGFYSIDKRQLLNLPPPGIDGSFVGKEYRGLASRFGQDCIRAHNVTLTYLLSSAQSSGPEAWYLHPHGAPTLAAFMKQESGLVDDVVSLTKQKLYPEQAPKDGIDGFENSSYPAITDLHTLSKLLVIDAMVAGKSGDFKRMGRDFQAVSDISSQVRGCRTAICQLVGIALSAMVTARYADLMKLGVVNKEGAQQFIDCASRWQETNVVAILPREYQKDIQLADSANALDHDVLGDGSSGLELSLGAKLMLRTKAGSDRLRALIADREFANYESVRNSMEDPYSTLAWANTLPFSESPVLSMDTLADFIATNIVPRLFGNFYSYRNRLSALSILSQAIIDQQTTGQIPSAIPWPKELKINAALFKGIPDSQQYQLMFAGTLTPQGFPHLPAFEYKKIDGGCSLTYPTTQIPAEKMSSFKTNGNPIYLETDRLIGGKLSSTYQLLKR